MARPVTTTGFAKVDRMFKGLEKKHIRPATSKGLRAGAKVVLSKAKAGVPHLSGVLEETLKVRVAGARTGRKLKKGEFGFSVIHIEKGAGDEIGRGEEGDPFYSRWVEYPTVKFEGDPYMRPALYDSTREVNAAVVDAIRKAVTKVRAK